MFLSGLICNKNKQAGTQKQILVELESVKFPLSFKKNGNDMLEIEICLHLALCNMMF